VDTWYETDPGDNLPAKVRSVAYLAFDDRFFYAGFEFDDPNPSAIRAPFTDRDDVQDNAHDWGGVILDTRNDGHSAIVLLATPPGGHFVAAPYVSAAQDARPRDVLGSPLVSDAVDPHGGLDVKWTPNADNAVDFTFKPDFSQIESDTAQITANQRFALFFPERR